MIETSERFDIDYIDPSGLCKCERCPAAYLFSRLMGLSQQDSPRIYLDFGTDIHAAVPYCYDNRNGLETAMEKFSEGWSARKYGEDDKKRNTMRAREMLVDFCETRAPDRCPYKVLPVPSEMTAANADIISPNECPYLIDIGGPLALAGRIDAVVEWNSTGDLWALDYKTASEISARLFTCFHNAPQALAYTLALSVVMNRRAKGLLVEALRVSPKNTETQVNQTFVLDHQLVSFKSFANRVAEDILRYNESGLWPKKSTGCGPYSMFGQPGFYCEYRDICDSPNWRDMIRYYEKREPFHPFKMAR